MQINSTSILNENRVPLEEAQARIEKWLDNVTPLFREDPNATPRALFIPMEDVKALLAEHPHADGIRVYYGIKPPVTKLPPSVEIPVSLEVCGLLVPVVQDDAGNHTDVLSGTINEDGTVSKEKEDDDNIYDFTTPCPVYCDKASKLYLPLPDQTVTGQ